MTSTKSIPSAGVGLCGTLDGVLRTLNEVHQQIFNAPTVHQCHHSFGLRLIGNLIPLPFPSPLCCFDHAVVRSADRKFCSIA